MSSLIEKIVNFFLLKKIMIFSNIEDSFFIYKKLDKKINLTESIIKLNYLKESPYSAESTEITSILKENNLYLWFNKKSNTRYLPEALLLYRYLQLTYSDVICIIKGEQDKAVIIKKNILISSFSKNNIVERDVLLMKSEYLLDKVVFIEESEYKSFLKKSYAYLTINDLLNILNIQVDIKSIFSKMVVWLAIPLFLSTIFITLALGIYNFYMEEEKMLLFDKYKENQKLTIDIKESIDLNGNENIAFNSLSNEFIYIDKTVAISNIIQITKDMNMTMSYIKIYDNQVDFIVRTKNQFGIPLYIKKLFESNHFVDIKNLSSQNLRDKRVQVRMNAKLRER